MRSAADRLSLVLAAGYLAAALHGLGGADIVGDDEAREAGVVQEILAGDWLWPRFNGETIPDKPLLFHWLAAVPCAVAGFSEAAVRLPSALAGAALVGWTGRFGTRLLGPPAGVVAAGLLATTPPLFTRARVARPDLLLVLLLSLALGLAFRWWSDRRRADATLALVALGAATLAKGPVAPVLFALTLGGFLAWQGQLRRLPALMTAPGVAAFLVLGLGWYLVALGGWGHLFVAQHLLGRYVFNLLGDVPAGGAYSTRPAGFHLFFYLKHLPAVALPWTPLVALTLWQAWRADGLRDPRVRFLVCWALAPVLAFTPAQYKLRHYLLPAVPALVLLAVPAAVWLWHAPLRRVGRAPALCLAGVAGLGAGLAAWAVATGAVALAASNRSILEGILAIVPGGAPGGTALAAAAAALLALLVARGAWRRLLALVAAATALWMGLGYPRMERAIAERNSLRAFAAGVEALHPAPAPLAFYRIEPIRPLIVYLGRHVPTLGRPSDASPEVAVITSESAHGELAAAGAAGPVLLTIEGRPGNLARARVVLARGRAP